MRFPIYSVESVESRTIGERRREREEEAPILHYNNKNS